MELLLARQIELTKYLREVDKNKIWEECTSINGLNRFNETKYLVFLLRGIIDDFEIKRNSSDLKKTFENFKPTADYEKFTTIVDSMIDIIGAKSSDVEKGIFKDIFSGGPVFVLGMILHYLMYENKIFKNSTINLKDPVKFLKWYNTIHKEFIADMIDNIDGESKYKYYLRTSGTDKTTYLKDRWVEKIKSYPTEDLEKELGILFIDSVRSFPKKMREEGLIKQNHICGGKGCNKSVSIKSDAHHKIEHSLGIIKGGITKLINLLILCKDCHKGVHKKK
jgi:5-methylcytosine-specific restriction endonuclease McrA